MPIRLKFPTHIQVRMLERELDAGHMKLAIAKPDFTEPTFQGRIKVRKELDDGRTVVVIYCKEDFRGTNDYLIITAYYI